MSTGAGVRTPASFSTGIGPIWSRLTQSALWKAVHTRARIANGAAHRRIRFSFALRESIVSRGGLFARMPIHCTRTVVAVFSSDSKNRGRDYFNSTRYSSYCRSVIIFNDVKYHWTD